MSRPFHAAPSPQAVRDEVKRIAESQATWSDDTVELIRNLDEFSASAASQIREGRISRAKIQHALALEYGASDWEDLIFLCETMEHDDFAQLRNRAKFLLQDHATRHPVAAVRLRKAMPTLREKSNGDIFDATITLADAQRTIAREYGFGSWRALRTFVQRHPATEGFLNTPGAVPPDVAAMVDAVDAGDAGRLKALIEANPSLVHARVASDITCGDTLLHRADPRATNGARMTKGHLEVAQLLIDSGIDIDAMGGCGDSCFTPPIDASSWIGNQRMAALMLDNGADPDRSYWTMTKPVRTAANHKGKAIFRMLLKAGAEYTLYETVALGFLKLTRELLDQDADAVNALDDGALPIVQAAQDVKMTRLLLRYGADPNGQDSRGVTALMEASQAGAKDVVEALLGGGAEPDIFFAIASGDGAAVEKMLAADPDCHRSEAVTPVILAAASGDRAIVEGLLKAGANPNEEQQHRWMQDSPLVTAVSHRHEHLVPVLLDYGAEVNPPRVFKWSIPLTAAVRWGTYAGVEMLLAAGADPSVVSDSGNIGNPLGWTAYVGDLRSAKMLVDAGADKAARSLAICGAAHHGRLSITELLGTLDTDLRHPDPGGNPMQRARANKHDQCLELLVELDEIQQLPKGRRDDILGPRAEFLHLLCSDDGPGLDALIAKHPELVDRDLVRNELFHHATGNHQGKVDRKPWLAAVEVLVRRGVRWTVHAAVACDRIEEVERLANGPGALKAGLHTAAKFNNVRAMNLLLDAGADIDAKETWGTALHEAARYRSVEAAECLIERGASINATDQYGNSPRSFCRPGTERSDAMCDLLDAHGASSLGHG